MNEQERRIAASVAGRTLRAVNSAKQQEAARENGKAGGRPRKNLDEVACTCGKDSGDTVTATGHPTTCPRGLLAWRHEKRRTSAASASKPAK